MNIIKACSIKLITINFKMNRGGHRRYKAASDLHMQITGLLLKPTDTRHTVTKNIKKMVVIFYFEHTETVSED